MGHGTDIQICSLFKLFYVFFTIQNASQISYVNKSLIVDVRISHAAFFLKPKSVFKKQTKKPRKNKNQLPNQPNNVPHDQTTQGTYLSVPQ